MKRLLVITFVLLLLAGCTANQTEQTPQTTQPMLEQPKGWYVQSSFIEQLTGGAVCAYHPEVSNIYGVLPIDDKILLVSRGEKTELTILTGTDGIPVVTAQLEGEAVGVQVINNGIAYYRKDTNEAIYLDKQLQPIRKVILPTLIQGVPLFSLDSVEIYYCWGSVIRAYDTTLNIIRPIKTHTCKSQTLLGLYFNGEVLASKLNYENGKENTVYLSVETGDTLYEDHGIYSLETENQNYLALRMDGTIRQHIYGMRTDIASNLDISQEGNTVSVLALNGVLAYTANAESLKLSFYDLMAGKKTAGLEVPVAGALEAVFADKDSESIWLLLGINNEQTLYRWFLKESQVQDETAYSKPVYTMQSPDVEGLKQCQDRVNEISDTHGVDLRIYTDAVKNQGEYTLQPEYQTLAINKALDELETVLELYPDLFLYKSVARRVRLCIVRSVSEECVGVQYWYDGDAYVVLSAGCDIREAFTKAMGYVVCSRVLGNSSIIDLWDNMNPHGFVYGETIDEKYLAEGSRYFADMESMISITEDRSRIFYHAMKDDNAAVFQSEAMQEKLKTFCRGIRDAWDWKKKTETFPWEQYLNESIAYKK